MISATGNQSQSVRGTKIGARSAISILIPVLIGVLLLSIMSVMNRPTINIADEATVEWFIERHEEIRRMDTLLRLSDQDVDIFRRAAGSSTAWDLADHQEWTRLIEVQADRVRMRQAMVEGYNTMAAMVTDRTFFEANYLPEQF